MQDSVRQDGVRDREAFSGGESRAVRAKRPPKRVLRGHEAFLEDLKNSGALVRFRLTSGGEILATIKTHDQYTVSVIVQDDDAAGGEGAGSGTPCVLFKHAIQCFVVLAPAQRGARIA
jgi:sRNA-binding regulator protein Hfq